MLAKAFGARPGACRPSRRPLGFVGAMLDAIGGGGWGPIVTTLLARRESGSRSVRSTRSSSSSRAHRLATFILTIGLYWPVIIGLALGGVRPRLRGAGEAPAEPVLMVLVGSVVVILSVRGLLKVLA